MKFADFDARVVESMGALFMVLPINTPFEPDQGDLVRIEDIEYGSWGCGPRGTFTWFLVGRKHEEDGVEWFDVRPATFWERLFGGRRGGRQHSKN